LFRKDARKTIKKKKERKDARNYEGMESDMEKGRKLI
jgi:hypothetical protein